MPLPVVQAVRYITSLREGGSMPALVAAEDGRQYVVKMRGAGQGPRVLAAEILTGELARALGVRVPELVLVELGESFGKTEPDTEVRELFKRSVGLNVGMAFLDDAATFDAAAGDEVSGAEASRIVWLDAFTMNVDRTAKNPNLLMRKGELWAIDHGASLTFHFGWPEKMGNAGAAFERVREHILLGQADEIAAASELAHAVLTEAELRRIVALVPDAFLPEDGMSIEAQRAAYLGFLMERLERSSGFEEEIARVR